MSIYGPSSGRGDEQEDLSSFAKTSYVDLHDNLHVLKAGDTVSGDLRLCVGSDTVRLLGCVDLSEGKGFSLPLGNFQNQLQFAVIAPPQTQTPATLHTSHGFLVLMNNQPVCQLGDPGPDNQLIVHRRIAMSNNLIKFLHDPAEPQDAATKNYVDTLVRRNKPLITVWAERKGTLGTGRYEWSFGAGANLHMHGYTMMAAGRVLRMGLTATRTTAPPSSTATVVIMVNGTTHASYGATTDKYSGTNTFGTPLELSQGDRVNFASATTNDDVLTAVVSVLIELDL